MRDYIPIDKDNIPERFQIDLANETYTLQVNYNEVADFFSVDLYDVDENPIVFGEKLILNEPLWNDLTDPRLPAPTLIPMDESNNEDHITFENLGETVFLYIDDVGEEDDHE